MLSSAFGFYAGLNCVAFVMIFFLMPGMSIAVPSLKLLANCYIRNETTNSGRTRLCVRCANQQACFLSTYGFPALLDQALDLFQQECGPQAIVQL